MAILENLRGYRRASEERKCMIWEMVERSKKGSSPLLRSVGLWDSIAPWNVLSQHFSPSRLSDLKPDLANDFNGFSVSDTQNAFAVMVRQ